MKRTLALILLVNTSTILCSSSDSIKTILEVGPEGKGNSKAAEAWSKITENADINSLIMVFDAMDQAGPIASNWLRSAAEVIAKNLELILVVISTDLAVIIFQTKDLRKILKLLLIHLQK